MAFNDGTRAAAHDPSAPKPRLRYWGDLCPALLEYLQSQSTKRAATREAYHALRCRYELPESWMEPVDSSSGESYFENRVRFAREYLCKHGLILRGGRRGIWALTARGIHTAPSDCPTPSESVKSKTGFTLGEIASMMEQLSRTAPEKLHELREKYGV